MLRLDADRPVEFCDGLRRRDFLHAGSLSALGLTLNSLFGLKAQGAVDGKQDVNCIMLMLVGGPSQLDTWDMKPNAPVEIRGPYKPIKTNVPGIEISENFPRMAKHADKFSLVRSMYHTAAAVHDSGHQMMQTGRIFQGGIEHPHIGCVLGKLKGPNGDVPPHVLLPRPIGNTGGNMPHGQNAGYLGKTLRSVRAECRSSDPNFRVPDMLPPDYLSALRVDRRRNWRAMVDKSVSKFETSQDARLLDSTFQQAYTLMSSQKAREAFELIAKPDAVREKYGHESIRPKLSAGAAARSKRACDSSPSICSKRYSMKSPGTSTDRSRSARSVLLPRSGGPDVRHGLQLAARRSEPSAAC